MLPLRGIGLGAPPGADIIDRRRRRVSTTTQRREEENLEIAIPGLNLGTKVGNHKCQTIATISASDILSI